MRPLSPSLPLSEGGRKKFPLKKLPLFTVSKIQCLRDLRVPQSWCQQPPCSAGSGRGASIPSAARAFGSSLQQAQHIPLPAVPMGTHSMRGLQLQQPG